MPYRPDSPEHAREVFEQQRNRCIERLRSYVEDWSDEIPSEIVRNEGNSKARSGWFLLVSGGIEMALDFLNDSSFSEEISSEIDPVLKLALVHAGDSDGERRNTKQQIDICNGVLRKVIARLEGM